VPEKLSNSKANGHSTSQEIPSLLWKLKVQYCVLISPQLVMNQVNPIHKFASHILYQKNILHKYTKQCGALPY